MPGSWHDCLCCGHICTPASHIQSGRCAFQLYGMFLQFSSLSCKFFKPCMESHQHGDHFEQQCFFLTTCMVPVQKGIEVWLSYSSDSCPVITQAECHSWLSRH